MPSVTLRVIRQRLYVAHSCANTFYTLDVKPQARQYTSITPEAAMQAQNQTLNPA